MSDWCRQRCSQCGFDWDTEFPGEPCPGECRAETRAETRAAVLREVRDWLKEQIGGLKDDHQKIDFSIPEEAAYLMAMTDTLEEFGPRGRFEVPDGE